MTPERAAPTDWQDLRHDSTVEAILSAAEDLFAEHGPSGVSMAQVATAAGCSRATLYRWFENRQALQVAFAGREARSVVASAVAAAQGVGSREERATATLLEVLRQVRSRPTLSAWTRPDHQSELFRVLSTAPWLAQVMDTGDPDRVAWLLHCVLGLLTNPVGDPDQEARLVARFLAPLLVDRPRSVEPRLPR